MALLSTVITTDPLADYATRRNQAISHFKNLLLQLEYVHLVSDTGEGTNRTVLLQVGTNPHYIRFTHSGTAAIGYAIMNLAGSSTVISSSLHQTNIFDYVFKIYYDSDFFVFGFEHQWFHQAARTTSGRWILSGGTVNGYDETSDTSGSFDGPIYGYPEEDSSRHVVGFPVAFKKPGASIMYADRFVNLYATRSVLSWSMMSRVSDGSSTYFVVIAPSGQTYYYLWKPNM